MQLNGEAHLWSTVYRYIVGMVWEDGTTITHRLNAGKTVQSQALIYKCGQKTDQGQALI